MSDPLASVETMGTPALVGIAALGGAITGGKVGFDKMRDAADWSRAIYQHDIQCLASGQQMPRIEAPPEYPRKKRNLLLVFLVGPLVCGILGFVGAALFVQLLASMSPDATGGTRVVGGIFWGFMGAGGGAFFVGTFLGLLLCLLELGARAKAFRTALRRDAWEQREQLRADLESGRSSPDQAIRELDFAITH